MKSITKMSVLPSCSRCNLPMYGCSVPFLDAFVLEGGRSAIYATLTPNQAGVLGDAVLPMLMINSRRAYRSERPIKLCNDASSVIKSAPQSLATESHPYRLIPSNALILNRVELQPQLFCQFSNKFNDLESSDSLSCPSVSLKVNGWAFSRSETDNISRNVWSDRLI